MRYVWCQLCQNTQATTTTTIKKHFIVGDFSGCWNIIPGLHPTGNCTQSPIFGLCRRYTIYSWWMSVAPAFRYRSDHNKRDGCSEALHHSQRRVWSDNNGRKVLSTATHNTRTSHNCERGKNGRTANGIGRDRQLLFGSPARKRKIPKLCMWTSILKTDWRQGNGACEGGHYTGERGKAKTKCEQQI